MVPSSAWYRVGEIRTTIVKMKYSKGEVNLHLNISLHTHQKIVVITRELSPENYHQIIITRECVQ